MSVDPFSNDRTIGTLQLLEMYREALDRLRSFGLRCHAQDRLHDYARTIERLGPRDHGKLLVDERKSLANALGEASIFVDVASLPDEYLSAVRKKMPLLNAGPVWEDIARADRARDTASELQFAARCATTGHLGAPATTRGDVLVRAAGAEYPTEVKRISSIGRIRQRVKEAMAQLEPKGDDPSGVIVLDVGACMRRRFGFVHSTNAEAFTDIAYGQLISFARHCVISVLERGDVLSRLGVLGLIVRSVAFGWVDDCEQVRRSIVTLAMPVVAEGSNEDLLFRGIAQSLEVAEFVEETDDGVRDAVEAFPLALPGRHRSPP